MFFQFKIFTIAGFCIFSLISCAGLEKKPAPCSEQNLSQRAELYWAAFTSRDWDQVEELIDPVIRQESDAYIRSLRESKPMAEYLSFREKNIEIHEDSAVVTYELEIKYLHPMLQGLPVQQRPAVDEWVRRNNQWYIVIKQPNMMKYLESIIN